MTEKGRPHSDLFTTPSECKVFSKGAQGSGSITSQLGKCDLKPKSGFPDAQEAIQLGKPFQNMVSSLPYHIHASTDNLTQGLLANSQLVSVGDTELYLGAHCIDIVSHKLNMSTRHLHGCG